MGDTMTEPFRSRWGRRAVTIPSMLGATLLGLAVSPLALLAAAVSDLVHARRRLPTARVILFLLQYGMNDCVEIVLSPLLWLLAGFGTRLNAPRSIRRHQRLQAWSLTVLAHRADRLLGLRATIDDAGHAALAPGPVVALCRHVSIVDASLPALLYQRLGFRSQGVIMAELLADPGFDLLYGRTGSVFINREDGPAAVSSIRSMGRSVDAQTALIVFPEGQLFRPERLVRSQARAIEREPRRATTIGGLRHVLPPRPAGTMALLDIVPAADVVIIAHTGLERFSTFAALARSVPLRDPIRVTAWRIPRAEIPTDGDTRVDWLDQQWARLDAWCESQS